MMVRGALESLTQSHRALHSAEISELGVLDDTSVEFI